MRPSREWFELVPGQVYLMSSGENQPALDVVKLTSQYDQECTAWIEASPSPLVHLITDVRGIVTVPPISNMSTMRFLKHPRLGYYITLGAMENQVLRFAATAVASMARLRYKDVSQLAEAYNLLIAKDPSLPSLNTWRLPPQMDVFA